MRRTITSASQMRREAAVFLKHASVRRGRSLVIALSGELGAGKTAFVQGLAKALGIRARVQSPTFVLMRRHALLSSRFLWKALVHIDAYRIEKPRDLLGINFREVFREPDVVIAVEWAERVKKLLPRDARWIRIQHAKKASERFLEIK